MAKITKSTDTEKHREILAEELCRQLKTWTDAKTWRGRWVGEIGGVAGGLQLN